MKMPKPLPPSRNVRKPARKRTIRAVSALPTRSDDQTLPDASPCPLCGSESHDEAYCAAMRLKASLAATATAHQPAGRSIIIGRDPGGEGGYGLHIYGAAGEAVVQNGQYVRADETLIHAGSINAGRIEANTVFSTQYLDSLPDRSHEGAFALLRTDNRLYMYTNGGWRAVPPPIARQPTPYPEGDNVINPKDPYANKLVMLFAGIVVVYAVLGLIIALLK